MFGSSVPAAVSPIHQRNYLVPSSEVRTLGVINKRVKGFFFMALVGIYNSCQGKVRVAFFVKLFIDTSGKGNR